jgi:hypothetical protein
MKHRTFTTRRAKSLTESLFSLEEPWRSRFLSLVANQATGWKWNDQPPTQREVANWLENNALQQKVTRLLAGWQG